MRGLIPRVGRSKPHGSAREGHAHSDATAALATARPAAEQHDQAKSKDECLVNGGPKRRRSPCIQIGRHLETGEPDLARLNLMENAGSEIQTVKGPLQPMTECVHHHNPENGNSQHAGHTRHRIVDARSGASAYADRQVGTTVVKGATVTAIPKPRTTKAGKKVVQ